MDFQEEQIAMLEMGEVEISPDFCKSGQYILLNKTIRTAAETSGKYKPLFTLTIL